MQNNNRHYKKFVCCADILGFSNMVSRLSLSKLKNVYNVIVESVKSACHGYTDFTKNPPEYKLPRVNHIWFSDTFILYSNDFRLNTENDWFIAEQIVTNFFQSAKILFLRFMYHGFPIRGVIEYGEFFAQTNQNIYVGKALVNAYKTSLQHEWAGIALTPGCSKKMLAYKDSSKLLISYKLPMKNSKNKTLKVVNWARDASMKDKGDLNEYLRKQFSKYVENRDGGEKLKNTITFVQHVLTKAK
ncbi:MAG: hypothetical protein A3I11_05650 [Elusimicrobia bacterium RIFCSPLOWO2_02_FULL_39_32]|nr:MAG: hypothetical protein A2034_07210 [Elusimicrobia bacterium GWA2_38_7]OGR80624.1 MAG: hypothetical protein A3B80_03830 [Elusimicrobia bacterium RIFCSPHIGHO2_02_FULL_39_36]OGR91473.1 MAG: hypothetical protein A3I11_05650 [Elusimicrobia bacterium RIFCSPLOWO2_02_FULL_39_32]OGS00728.1 MAG: hypothetical protein A3G85_04250 [Elusimicrobia bacterium RIFCSPLOWO2_12_FULL_39_28]